MVLININLWFGFLAVLTRLTSDGSWFSVKKDDFFDWFQLFASWTFDFD
jgi:hypothetical protein